jgi:peptidoglycan-N-acetylmuramic acid deacetylase
MKLLQKIAAGITAGAMAFINVALPVSATDYSTFDGTSQGYGMGRDVDSGDRPYGAENFNADYGIYGAYAMFPAGSGVVLTFDEGYENGYTCKILDTLAEKGVKAIFFVTGDYVKSNKPLIRRMIDEGHIVGNHGMKHKSIPGLSFDGVKDDIMPLHEMMKTEFGYDMTYFRPPCGEFSEKALKQVQDLGYITLMWSFAYVDWKENSQPDRVVAFKRMTESAHEGEIMLLHAVSPVNAELLPDVIDNIREQDLEFVLPLIVYKN